MCGLVSVLTPGVPVEEVRLRSALMVLRHRGPDGEGLWIAPDRQVALGHTRLSIIDLQTGQQPLVSEDEQTVLIVNGEFYGFEQIRRGLQHRGHRFRTRSDSEIALHLYEEYGVDCLAQLRGEFALILWDQKTHTLLAARDRFGIKPLCYAAVGDSLLIASEAKALFALGVEPVWDREAFYHAASMQYVPPARTLFQGVSQLPPGHYLLARNGRVDVTRYWDMDYPLQGRQLPENEESLQQELAERLDQAVRLRLRADVPVCFHLSGGLDSSAVVGVAARYRGKPLDCFTVSFEKEPYDELALAEEMAAHVGARLQPVRVTQTDLLEALPDAVYFSEGLAINGHLPAKFLLSRAIQEAGFKVVLSGEGSDEILAGYPHLRQDLLLADNEGTSVQETSLAHLYASNAIMVGIQLPEGPSLPLDAVERILGFVPSFLRAKGSLGYRMHTLLSDDFLSEFHEQDAYRILLDGMEVAGQLASRQRVDQSCYLWTKLALANYILRTLGDGTEMAHGVEGRLPFLDHPLFEFARRVPLSLKIKGSVEKYLLREAMRPVLTPAVYRRQKQPFTAPPLAPSNLLDDLLHSTDFGNVPFFDRRKVFNLLDSLPRREQRERVALDPVLMMVLTTTLLQHRYRLQG